jgi:hypothetical protein
MLFKILPWIAALFALGSAVMLYLTNGAIQQALAVVIAL